MDVLVWLRSLGLERYDALFREHEIDAEVLPELSDADLSGLGIPLGPRKKLLKAIAALGVGVPGAETGGRSCGSQSRGRAPPIDGDVLSIWSARRRWRRGSIPRICAR